MEEERVVEEVSNVETREPSTYEKITKLNMSLDELSKDVANDNPVNDNENVLNIDNDIIAPVITDNAIEPTVAADVVEPENEISIPEANDEELVKDLTSDESLEEEEKGSKGQFVLIIILSIILIALLVAMIVFTNSL